MATTAPTTTAPSPKKRDPSDETGKEEKEEPIHVPAVRSGLSYSSPVGVSTWEEMNPSRRCSMEDCSVFLPPGTWEAPTDDMAYLGIYDGHGGRDMVEYLEHGLSYHVAQELSCRDDADMATRFERAFLMADIHSKQLGIKTSGATVAVCLVKKPKYSNTLTLYTANAGDARIVLAHEGKATRLTKDHRTDDPTEVERIEKAGGFMFKGRVLGVLAITRSLGDHCMKSYVIAQPYCQTKTIELPVFSPSSQPQEQPHDIPSEPTATSNPPPPSFLILACDGLWDVFADQDAVNFVLKYQEHKERIAEYLVNEALRRGTTDNVTVQVAWL